MTIYCISIFSRRSFSKFHDTLCLQCGKDMEDVDIKRRIFAKTLNYYSSIGRVHCSETTEETTLTFYQQISFAVLVGTKI